jgi:hypothetical protein
MKTVYLLWHTHVFENGPDDEKLIGVYESALAARQAQARVADQPGFRDHPEGFEISAYELGKDHWTEGFVVIDSGPADEIERGRNGT